MTYDHICKATGRWADGERRDCPKCAPQAQEEPRALAPDSDALKEMMSHMSSVPPGPEEPSGAPAPAGPSHDARVAIANLYPERAGYLGVTQPPAPPARIQPDFAEDPKHCLYDPDAKSFREWNQEPGVRAMRLGTNTPFTTWAAFKAGRLSKAKEAKSPAPDVRAAVLALMEWTFIAGFGTGPGPRDVADGVNGWRDHLKRSDFQDAVSAIEDLAGRPSRPENFLAIPLPMEETRFQSQHGSASCWNCDFDQGQHEGADLKCPVKKPKARPVGLRLADAVEGLLDQCLAMERIGTLFTNAEMNARYQAVRALLAEVRKGFPPDLMDAVRQVLDRWSEYRGDAETLGKMGRAVDTLRTLAAMVEARVETRSERFLARVREVWDNWRSGGVARAIATAPEKLAAIGRIVDAYPAGTWDGRPLRDPSTGAINATHPDAFDEINDDIPGGTRPKRTDTTTPAQDTADALAFGLHVHKARRPFPETPFVLRLTRKEFEAMPDYSASMPTGTTIGKRWRRRKVYSDPTKGWVIGEYIPDKEPDTVGVKWWEVEITDEPGTSPEGRAP